MEHESDLAPWAHPKAIHWYETLFERSGLLYSLRVMLDDETQNLTCNQLRSTVALLYLLSIEGIWPAEERPLLTKLTLRIHTLAKKIQIETGSKPLTVSQHQQAIHAQAQLEHELEMLRRRVGISNRKTPLKRPPDWQRVWN